MNALKLAAFVALPACASQAAYWHKTCAPGSHFVTVAQLHDSSYEQGCAASKRLPTEGVITAPGTFPPAKAENTFYSGGGMLWVNPKSDDYAERSAGLQSAVFPFASLNECRAAGACLQDSKPHKGN